MDCFFVYILYSESLDKFYTGHSQYRQKRCRQHRQPSRKSWAGQADDWQEVWYGKVESRSEAAALERKIKKRGAKRFLQDQERSG